MEQLNYKYCLHSLQYIAIQFFTCTTITADPFFSNLLILCFRFRIRRTFCLICCEEACSLDLSSGPERDEFARNLDGELLFERSLLVFTFACLRTF